MYRTATISAYDVMGDVFITATVRTYEPDGETFDSTEFRCATTVQGVGEPDTAEWLQDALVALLERL